MNGRFVVRPKARRDIAEIADYIAADNLEASDRFIDEVYRAFELLSKMPHMGSARRFRREGSKGLRLWRVPHFQNYLIVYRPLRDGVEVVFFTGLETLKSSLEADFSSLSTTKWNNKLFAFVLMPFKDAFTDIYKFGIKETATKLGIVAERVDEQIYLEGMLERIYRHIEAADIFIADMTGKNENVFYEVGYAHAKDKLCILLTSDANNIPFDLKHRRRQQSRDCKTAQHRPHLMFAAF